MRPEHLGPIPPQSPDREDVAVVGVSAGESGRTREHIRVSVRRAAPGEAPCQARINIATIQEGARDHAVAVEHARDVLLRPVAVGLQGVAFAKKKDKEVCVR